MTLTSVIVPKINTLSILAGIIPTIIYGHKSSFNCLKIILGFDQPGIAPCSRLNFYAEFITKNIFHFPAAS